MGERGEGVGTRVSVVIPNWNGDELLVEVLGASKRRTSARSRSSSSTTPRPTARLRARVILPGVTIREGAVVGALSIVKRDVEPFTIVAGSDARVIGTRKRDLLERESRVDD